jgi:hypothetical protein
MKDDHMRSFKLDVYCTFDYCWIPPDGYVPRNTNIVGKQNQDEEAHSLARSIRNLKLTDIKGKALFYLKHASHSYLVLIENNTPVVATESTVEPPLTVGGNTSPQYPDQTIALHGSMPLSGSDSPPTTLPHPGRVDNRAYSFHTTWFSLRGITDQTLAWPRIIIVVFIFLTLGLGFVSFLQHRENQSLRSELNKKQSDIIVVNNSIESMKSVASIWNKLATPSSFGRNPQGFFNEWSEFIKQKEIREYLDDSDEQKKCLRIDCWFADRPSPQKRQMDLDIQSVKLLDSLFSELNENQPDIENQRQGK